MLKKVFLLLSNSCIQDQFVLLILVLTYKEADK